MASMLARALRDGTRSSGDSDGTGALAVLASFRAEWFACLTGRAEELFELTDAVLCADGPVKTLVGLALTPRASAWAPGRYTTGSTTVASTSRGCA